MSEAVRVAAAQTPHFATIEENLSRAERAVAEARDAGARLVVLPEYFWAPLGPPATAAPRMDEVRAALARVSRGIAVAANVLEAREGALHNTGVVYDAGASVYEQDKMHPMPREAASGVVGGARLAVGRVAGVAAGMLVCADILYPESARILALQGAEVLLNPVMSPYKPVDATKGARDSVFVARAWDNAAFVVKAGGFRKNGPHPVAGRSLVAAPWGLLARHRDDFTEDLLVVDLDLDALRAFRKEKDAFPPRRPETYGELVDWE